VCLGGALGNRRDEGSDLPEDSQSVVCGHCHLLIIDIAPTHAKVDIEQQRLGAFLHDPNPKFIEVWRDHGPKKWVGVRDSPP
jgi:hypothetical protein